MKKKSLLIIGLINLIPALILFMNVSEIVDASLHPERYPFGSDFFSPYSIYQSSRLYIIYQVIFSVSLIALILSSIWGKKKMYYTLLIVNMIMLFYPLLTNE